MSDDEEEDDWVAILGTDLATPVYRGMPCIVCGKPVATGEGAQAVPPMPAVHTVCMRKVMRTD